MRNRLAPKDFNISVMTAAYIYLPTGCIFFFQALQKEVSNRLGYNDVGGEEAKKHIFFRNINWPQLEAGMFKPPFVPDVSSLIGVV